MAWGLSERQARKEREKAERAEEERNRKEEFYRESLRGLGCNFDELDDDQLATAIGDRIRAVSDGIASHEWSRDFIEVAKGENELAGDDLIRIMLNQNWVIIQQNERICRLLEQIGK